MGHHNMKKFGTATGETPQEMHARLAWRGRTCFVCNGPPAIRIKVLAPFKDLFEAAPKVVMQIAASNPDPENAGKIPVIPTKYGPMLKTSDVFACNLHKGDAEKAAARGPSWCIVEIDRGPDPKNRVSVAGSLKM